MALKERLKSQIRNGGPLSVAQYMTLCLHDPADGYYAVRPGLGATGDFITAPLVSQMFGELIGLWFAAGWENLGAPDPLRLVELGPGSGVLMSDLLRACRTRPGFLEAADLWLIEASEPLRRRQMATLEGAPLRPRWAERLEDAPAGAPLFLVANEFLDCLPANQFVRTREGWRERRIGLDDSGELVFGLGAPTALRDAPEAEPGAILEISPAQAAFGSAIGERIARDGGLALLIDYGRLEPGTGDTLQALRGHRKEPVLNSPGQADLTVHVDFPSVLEAAVDAGAAAVATTQGAFLLGLGIEARAAALARRHPEKAAVLSRQLERLVHPDQMGELFKVACIYQPGAPPPGFGVP